METVRASALEAVSIPAHALRLFGRHWPALLTLVCSALAVRAILLWLAVVVSDHNSFVATLILPLAPLALMTGLIFALWVMQPSLPFLSSALKDQPSAFSKRRLMTIGGLLIPFLTVYASHGLLKDDIKTFIYDATQDESANNFSQTDFSRVVITNSSLMIGLVIVTIVLRKIIGYFALGEKKLGLASFSAYLEVLWMVTISTFIASQFSEIQEWISTREVIAPAYHAILVAKGELIARSGMLGKAYAVTAFLVGKLDDIIVVPLAWLTLGAVLFGTTLIPKKKKKSGPKHARNAQATQGNAVKISRSGQLLQLTKAEARGVVDTATQPIWGPVKLTWNGLKQLATAGAVPMMIFCLIFVLASATELGVVELGRYVVGPRPLLEGSALDSYVLVVARASYFVVALTLLAAALDRFLSFSHAES